MSDDNQPVIEACRFCGSPLVAPVIYEGKTWAGYSCGSAWRVESTDGWIEADGCRLVRAKREIERLRALVQCCERDHNYDGNCDRHPNGLRGEVERLRAQLPDGMQHCTIQFKQCPKGHGWLTAVNWVQHGCPTCEIERLQAELQKTLDAGATWERAYWETKQKLLAVATDLDEAWQERDEAREAARAMRGLLETAIHVRDVGLDRFGVQMQVTDEWYDKARELTKDE